jgi:hypothetical protein
MFNQRNEGFLMLAKDLIKQIKKARKVFLYSETLCAHVRCTKKEALRVVNFADPKTYYGNNMWTDQFELDCCGDLYI